MTKIEPEYEIIEENGKKKKSYFKYIEYEIDGEIGRKKIELGSKEIKPKWKDTLIHREEAISHNSLIMFDSVKLENEEKLLDESPKIAIRLLNNDNKRNIKGFKKSIVLPLDKHVLKQFELLIHETIRKM